MLTYIYKLDALQANRREFVDNGTNSGYNRNNNNYSRANIYNKPNKNWNQDNRVSYGTRDFHRSPNGTNSKIVDRLNVCLINEEQNSESHDNF